MGSSQSEHGEKSEGTRRVDFELKSVFCSVLRWMSYYLVPRYSSNWRCHYTVICSDNHISKHWRYVGRASLRQMLMSLWIATVSPRRGRLLIYIYIQMPSGWWSWNAALGRAHNGPQSNYVAETASHSRGWRWKAAPLFYEFTSLQAADKVYALIFF